MFRIVAYLLWECQLQGLCPYCWVDELGIERTPAERTAQEWGDMLVRAAYNRPTLVDFVGGEPLLFPDFHGLCKQLASEHIRWAITSNTIDTDTVRQFVTDRVPYCVVWNVSLQPQSPQSVVQNTLALRNAGYPLSLNVVDHPDAPHITDTAGMRMSNIPYQDWNKHKNGKYKAVDGRKRMCDAGREHVVIAPNGDYYGCLVDLQVGKEPLGNGFASGIRWGTKEHLCETGCSTCYTHQPGSWSVRMREVQ